MFRLKFSIGVKMMWKMFQAISIPKIIIFGFEQSLRYFIAVFPSRKNSMIPVPSKGGSGRRLKQNKTRFSVNVMLSITASPRTAPVVSVPTKLEKAK